MKGKLERNGAFSAGPWTETTPHTVAMAEGHVWFEEAVPDDDDASGMKVKNGSHRFSNIPCVCPEPVLANHRF
jgi:hypothetical protein